MSKRIVVTSALIIVTLLPLSLLAAEPATDGDAGDPERLLGSWKVTSAQTSLILNIEPEHKVLILWIGGGGFRSLRTSWEELHGGIIIHSMPRMRLWPDRGERKNRIRVELEAVPEAGIDPNKNFHDHFFMNRIKFEEFSQAWQDRPVPERWNQTTLSDDWNNTAGREPLKENVERAD